MAKKQSNSQRGGVNITGKAKVGGKIYQGDKVATKNVTINRSGGTNFEAKDGGIVNIAGDLVGRNVKNIYNNGMSADDVAKLFDSIYKRIDQKPREERQDIRNAVDVIKTAAKDEAVDGKAPDTSAVTMASQSLAMTAPEILKDVADVAMATLASPAAGVATIIRKVLAKIKQ
jgi:hypothetical protein